MSKNKIDDIFPLSPMQALMLTHSESGRGSLALVNQFRYRIQGNLNIDRFRTAWQLLTDRHQSLRTGFFWEELNEPVQVVRKQVSLPFEYIDLRVYNKIERENHLTRILQSDRMKSFDVRKAPLMRLTLIQFDTEDYSLLWSRHHLILDRWSADIIFNELFELYSTQCNPAKASGTFRDYIEWIQQQNFDQAKTYWRELLENFSQPTLIFGDPQTPMHSVENGLPHVQHALEEKDFSSLLHLSRQHQVTLASILIASIAIVVSAISQSKKVIFGLTISGRPPDLVGVETTLGSFINNIPVAIELDYSQPVFKLFAKIQAQSSSRNHFDYVSTATIHQSSKLSSNLPLFDLLILLHSPTTETLQGPGFALEQIDSPFDSVYPFTLSIAEMNNSLCLTGLYQDQFVSKNSALTLLQLVTRTLILINQNPEIQLRQIVSALDTRDINFPSQINASSISIQNKGLPTSSRPSENDTAATLINIWRNVLGISELGMDHDFFAMGGSSLQAAIAFAEIERQLGYSLPLSTLLTAGSIRKILNVLDQPKQRLSCLVSFQTNGSNPPLFVVPGVGGNVVGLESLSRGLGARQPFYGLQSMGLDGQQKPKSSVEEIAAEYIAELPVRKDSPFILFGICTGATIAFEMAQQLKSRGLEPDLLILLDLVFKSTPTRGVSVSNRYISIIKFVMERLQLYWSEYSTMDSKQRGQWLAEKKTNISNALFKKKGAETSRMVINQYHVIETNLVAQQRYKPKKYAGSSALLVTRDRNLKGQEDLRKASIQYLNSKTPFKSIRGKHTNDAIKGDNALALVQELRKLIDGVKATRSITAR